MPGERLVCVWQAAYVQDPETVGSPRKAIVQCLTNTFNKSDHINFKPLVFDNHFKVTTFTLLRRHSLLRFREKRGSSGHTQNHFRPLLKDHGFCGRRNLLKDHGGGNLLKDHVFYGRRETPEGPWILWAEKPPEGPWRREPPEGPCFL